MAVINKKGLNLANLGAGLGLILALFAPDRAALDTQRSREWPGRPWDPGTVPGFEIVFFYYLFHFGTV